MKSNVTPSQLAQPQNLRTPPAQHQRSALQRLRRCGLVAMALTVLPGLWAQPEDGRLLSAPPGHPKPAKTGQNSVVFRAGPAPVSQGSERVTYGQLSITPDGERLCIVTPSAGAAVFDAATGKRFDHLGANSSEGLFLPDGRWFVQAADKRAPVSIRAVLTGERLSQLFEAAPPPAPKMATLAATQFENRFRTGRLLLSEDGGLLSAPATNGVVVFDLARAQLVACFEFPNARALPVAFSPDGKALLVGRAPNEALAELKLMRLADGIELCSIPRPQSGWVGRRVAIGHYNENGGHDEVIGSRFRVCELARFSSHGEILALVQAEPAQDRCLVEVREIPSGSLKFQISLNFLPTQAGFIGASLTLAVTGFVKDNVPFLSRASPGTKPTPTQDLVLIDARNGEVIHDFHLDAGTERSDRSVLFNGWDGGGLEMGAMSGCLDFAVSPNGKLVAVASMDTFIHLIELDKTAEVESFRGHSAGVIRVAFHPSGRWVYSLDATGEVRRWPVNRESREQPQ
jgi:WD domain, G-beta repeat